MTDPWKNSTPAWARAISDAEMMAANADTTRMAAQPEGPDSRELVGAGVLAELVGAASLAQRRGVQGRLREGHADPGMLGGRGPLPPPASSSACADRSDSVDSVCGGTARKLVAAASPETRTPILSRSRIGERVIGPAQTELNAAFAPASEPAPVVGRSSQRIMASSIRPRTPAVTGLPTEPRRGVCGIGQEAVDLAQPPALTGTTARGYPPVTE